MSKIIPPDRGVKETVIGGKSYYQSRSGSFEVTNPRHVKAMKAEGFFEASLNPYTEGDNNRGWVCVECGFNGWFSKCGRCGHENNNIPKDGD